MALQSAMRSGPNRFNAICTYGAPKAEVSLQQLRAAVASLIAFFQSNGPDNLRVLVAVRQEVLNGMKDGVAQKDVPAIASIGGGKFKLDDALVFAQVSAQSDVHRLYALRVIAEALAPVLTSREELIGQRLLNGQDPLGFQDKIPGAGDYAKGVVTALDESKDGAWLLFQRFELDVKAFFQRNPQPSQRASVVGIAPMGPKAITTQVNTELAANLPSNSHVALVKGTTGLVRRSFSYRHSGEEGLAFVAVSATFETIAQVLTKITSGGDQLLTFATSRGGGMYFVPQSAAWLADGFSIAPLVPTTVEPLQKADHLTSYDTTSAFFDYLMFLKANGLFDNPDLPNGISTAARPIMNQLYEALAAGDSSKVAQMRAMEDASFSQAKTVNADYDQYITYG